MSKEVGAGGRFDIFLDSAKINQRAIPGRFFSSVLIKSFILV